MQFVHRHKSHKVYGMSDVIKDLSELRLSYEQG
ncbi:pyridoxamine 5'-phosphate oxidase, partial [Acinetobacter baumannii]|nr:pyridoxamine 5'-phosphate oxidase [Acinetobacter baumannii]